MDPFTWTINTGRLAKTYIQKLCADTGCSLEDLPGAMDDREGVAGEGQGDLCWWRDMMMISMLIMMMNFMFATANIFLVS